MCSTSRCLLLAHCNSPTPKQSSTSLLTSPSAVQRKKKRQLYHSFYGEKCKANDFSTKRLPCAGQQDTSCWKSSTPRVGGQRGSNVPRPPEPRHFHSNPPCLHRPCCYFGAVLRPAKGSASVATITGICFPRVPIRT